MKSRRRQRARSRKSSFSLPDLPRIQPRLSMLNREDCLQIHQASLTILRRTGVEVLCPEALTLLQKAGADISGNLVKFPSSLVEWALAAVPNQFNLYQRGSEEVTIRLDGRSVAETLVNYALNCNVTRIVAGKPLRLACS